MQPNLVEHKFIPISQPEAAVVPKTKPASKPTGSATGLSQSEPKIKSVSTQNSGIEKYITCNKLCFFILIFMLYMLWSRYKNYEKPLMLSYDKTEPRPYNI